MHKYKTPLDNLIVELASYSINNVSNPNSFVILVQQQLGILRVLYNEMHKIDYYKNTITQAKKNNRSITIEEFALNQNQDINKSITDYQSYLYVINQFGRALKKKCLINLEDFPCYYEIQFYRNKVAEHWDDYIDAMSRGVTFSKGKCAIPIVGRVFLLDIRPKIAKQLEEIFYKFGLNIKIPDEFNQVSTANNDPKYAEFIYTNLRKIDVYLKFNCKKEPNKTLNDMLITLLFDFGFPSPILDLEEYTIILAAYIRRLVKEYT